MNVTKNNLLKARNYEKNELEFYSLKELFKSLPELSKLPYSMRVVLENLIRKSNTDQELQKVVQQVLLWMQGDKNQEVDFYPSRVLLQDFTGVPVIVDLAAMRDGAIALGGDSKKINPLIPVDLVIDHSVIVNYYGDDNALQKNIDEEYKQNLERYKFLKWGQNVFENFKVVPPGMGICHQVNLEYLAEVIFHDKKSDQLYPDTVIGTDSHTTMVNGLGVLGWGVGGIEAEAVMLGESISMVLPDVVGFKLIGKLGTGVTATDLVLTVTEILRGKGVVNKFVEFCGEGMKNLSVADRATIANMSPEYGATCGFFPIDEKTLNYLRLTGREESKIRMIKEYSEEVMLWNNYEDDLKFTELIELDMSKVRASLAGPKRPQDRCYLEDVYNSLIKEGSGFPEAHNSARFDVKSVDPVDNIFSYIVNQDVDKEAKTHSQRKRETYDLGHGDVVIAAITSCTNTSNPFVLVGAGLLAKKAVERGMKVKPYVKTSLAPGSRVVSQYLENSGLQKYLDELGFNVIGYGCTTCIGNSGPLKPEIERTIRDNDLCVAGVLSGNRNFEGRIHPLVQANYLASPPLVVAFALAGSLNVDLKNGIIGYDSQNKAVYLREIWPDDSEITEYIEQYVTQELFKKNYSTIFEGEKTWQNIEVSGGDTYKWDEKSTYIKNPPYFENFSNGNTVEHLKNIEGARILGLFGDSITTDHISPAGNIKEDSPAGLYLKNHGVQKDDFNSYGSRRGNHEVMMRGTFANTRLKNEIVTKQGGFTKFYSDESDSSQEMTIFDASMKYQKNNAPLVIFAGKEYGSGSSRDWAAKGVFLLGVKAVIAESFERIHRSNLIGMGVIPFTFMSGETRISCDIKGDSIIDILNLDQIRGPKQIVTCVIKNKNGALKNIKLMTRIDTEVELETLLAGGVLQKVLRKLI